MFSTDDCDKHCLVQCSFRIKDSFIQICTVTYRIFPQFCICLHNLLHVLAVNHSYIDFNDNHLLIQIIYRHSLFYVLNLDLGGVQTEGETEYNAMHCELLMRKDN